MAGYIEEVRHEVTGTLPYLRVPLHIDGEPVDTRSPSPLFGSHTREVMAEWLGKSSSEIDAALETGAVGGAPDPERLRQFYVDVGRGKKT
jgi:crotonobetainyl-CoA:carnitine CoA-transferase CaiB-like acyl-CoA transferase